MTAHAELHDYVAALAAFAERTADGVPAAEVVRRFRELEAHEGTAAALACARLVFERMVEHDELALPESPSAQSGGGQEVKS